MSDDAPVSDSLPPPLPEARPSALVRALAWLDRQGENYRLTRFVLLRFTGLVYFIAFLSAAQQFIPLVGHDGLLPADLFVQRAKDYYGSTSEAFWAQPSLFWFGCDDTTIRLVTWTGTVLSALVLCGFANSLIMLVLWALYLSLHPIGQEWFGYGWDIQILETGFLGIMLCPLLNLHPFPKRAPPVFIIWLYRWLIFRIMLGAGMIKVRATNPDKCWRDLTALFYHYETQPIPNPLSRVLHFAPQWFQKFGVLWNHFVELIVPWFSFYGRWARHIAGVLMISFMGILIFSGNLSFLNWLTIIPALACLDDRFWKRVLPRCIVACSESSAEHPTPRSNAHLVSSLIYSGLVAWLSIPVVKNLVSDRQVMNGSFNSLCLVNTYGAFGTIDRERFELIFEGCDDEIPSSFATWKAYEFKAKPGDPMHRPVVITPYHYRLDWAAWYPWSQVPGRNAWVGNFIWKLLHNDPGTLSLIASNPFPDKPPRWIRVSKYQYHYAPLGNKDGAWWTRERLGEHIPPLSATSPKLLEIVRATGGIRD